MAAPEGAGSDSDDDQMASNAGANVRPYFLSLNIVATLSRAAAGNDPRCHVA